MKRVYASDVTDPVVDFFCPECFGEMGYLWTWEPEQAVLAPCKCHGENKPWDRVPHIGAGVLHSNPVLWARFIERHLRDADVLIVE